MLQNPDKITLQEWHMFAVLVQRTRNNWLEVRRMNFQLQGGGMAKQRATASAACESLMPLWLA